MMDGIPWSSIAAPSAGVLVAIICLLVLTGRLTTSRALDRADRETGHWRATCDSLTKTISQQSSQLERLVEYARTADAVLRSLPTPDRDRTT